MLVSLFTSSCRDTSCQARSFCRENIVPLYNLYGYDPNTLISRLSRGMKGVWIAWIWCFLAVFFVVFQTLSVESRGFAVDFYPKKYKAHIPSTCSKFQKMPAVSAPFKFLQGLGNTTIWHLIDIHPYPKFFSNIASPDIILNSQSHGIYSVYRKKQHPHVWHIIHEFCWFIWLFAWQLCLFPCCCAPDPMATFIACLGQQLAPDGSVPKRSYGWSTYPHWFPSKKGLIQSIYFLGGGTFGGEVVLVYNEQRLAIFPAQMSNKVAVEHQPVDALGSLSMIPIWYHW